jgi:hypothetical protein
MKEDRWHQEIVVSLKVEKLMFSELAKILNRLGYSTDESGEVFFCARQDRVEQWQTETLVTVSVFNNDIELDYYDDEEQEINKIELGYLLPWQPIENADIFVSKVWELSGELATRVLLDEKNIEKESLLLLISNYANDLKERLEPPGGEFLAQAIAQDLPI